jgi:thiamine pyrophosphokinase
MMGTTAPAAATSAALVIGGGAVRPPRRHHDLVITADSGLDVALAAGFRPTHLVGDLDSISAAGRAWAEEHGVHVETHPADKDATDTALALALVVRLGAERLHVYGNTGIGRLDHLLGTLVALGDPVLHELATITAHLDDTTVHVLHPGHSVEVTLPRGAVFSLLALHGRCDGVEVTGARWPLERARFTAGSTLGISNEALDADVPVRVFVAGGVLTVVVPAPDAR